jgi:hypothetical protein
MKVNPYASPAEFTDDMLRGAVDAAARDEIARLVEGYLCDQIGAFEFDKRLWEIHGRTTDRTVKIVASQLWYFYDDVTDHLAVMDKQAWNAIQRLLLVLKSNAELQWAHMRVWHVSQAIALLTLCVTAWACLPVWQTWPIYFIPAGFVSIALSWWRERKLWALHQPDPWNMWPFNSFGAIDRALARAPDFRKLKYRAEVGRRRIRSASSEFVGRLHSWVGWCIWSPIALIAQCFPLRIERLVLIEPSAQ